MFRSVKYLDGDKEDTAELSRPGKVLVEFENGDTFNGTYIKNEQGNGLIRSGQGIYIWKSGGKYDGNYENGKRNGTGTYVFPNGEKYEGTWKNNIKSGEGRYLYSNGDIFTGVWVSDKRNGDGVFYNKEEDMEIEGIWKEGKLMANSVKKKKPELKLTKAPQIIACNPILEAPKAEEKVVEETKPVEEEKPEPVEEVKEDKAEVVEEVKEEKSEVVEEVKEEPVEEVKKEDEKVVEELDKAEAAAEDSEVAVPVVVPPVVVEPEAAVEEEKGSMVIVIAGPPASGKGTQCKQIVDKFGVVHISTGDLLRAAAAGDSEAGKKAKEQMASGGLVDTDLINAIFKERLEQDDCKKQGVLLDGYPRTKEQAEDLKKMGVEVDLIVLLEVPDEKLIKRACGRRVAVDGGEIYHIDTKPPPEGVEVSHRDDDKEDKVVNRLKVYGEQIDAIKGFYGEGIKTVDGDRDPADVTKDVVSLVEEVEKKVNQ